MADKKISALTAAATPLAGTEVLPIVQSGATVKVSVDNLTNGKTVTANKFYAPSTDATPIDIRRSVANNTVLANVADSPSLSNANYVLFGIDVSGGSVGYSSGGAFVSTGANGTGTARPLILHTYGNNDIVFARQNTQIASISANGFAPVAGKGIDFSANTHAAGMTSELLNDYEEGTWTPVVAGSGTAGTYEIGTNGCTYTKVGRLVTIQGFIQFAAVVTAGGTGDLRITGLPYSKSANSYPVGSVYLATGTWSGNHPTVVFGSFSASATLLLQQDASGGFGTAIPISFASANAYLSFTISYEV